MHLRVDQRDREGRADLPVAGQAGLQAAVRLIRYRGFKLL